MALKIYKPTSPGSRGLVRVDRSELWKKGPYKALTEHLSKNGGRNNHGRITVRHQGGGYKKRYRIIDFKRLKHDVFGTVERIEYDPNRTAFIALIKYTDNDHAYIIAPQKLKVGDTVVSGYNAEIKIGNCLPLSSIPVGTLVHNVELKKGKGGQIARSAGCYARVMGHDSDKMGSSYVSLRLKSGEMRYVLASCTATIGAVSNPDAQNEIFAKAGRIRNKGIRPTVRGMAMNPVDHPKGGGEGKSKSGEHPRSPTGVLAKGYKTRSNKRTDKFRITSRHNAKRK